MKQLSIMGISVDNRKDIAPNVQEVLTKYGDIIMGRFGIHDPGEVKRGLITLNLLSTQEELNLISNELSELEGVQVKYITMR